LGFLLLLLLLLLLPTQVYFVNQQFLDVSRLEPMTN
jgi:hypothetical protein